MINVGLDYGGRDYAPIQLPITDGVTETIFCPWSTDMILQVDVSGLGSGGSLSVTVDGSLDNTGWDNIDANNTPTTVSSDGTTLLEKRIPTPYVKINGLSSPGATVVAQVYFRRLS